jgi:hypothetical protein
VVPLFQVVLVSILLAHGDVVSGSPALAGVPLLVCMRSAVVDVEDGESAPVRHPLIVETCSFLSVLDQYELLGSHLVVDLIDLRLNAGGDSLLYRVVPIPAEAETRLT